MKKFLALLTVLCLIATASYAAFPTTNSVEFTTKKVDGYGTLGVITLEGEINRAASEKVQEAFGKFKADDVRKVIFHLNSPGGDIVSGKKIISEMISAEIYNKVVIITYVGADQLCASMCTGVYAIGTFREASPKSYWVFHSPYVKTATKSVEEQIAVDESIELTRSALMVMYNLADKEFAETYLKPYVYKTAKDKELVVTGEIIKTISKSYINVLVD